MTSFSDMSISDTVVLCSESMNRYPPIFTRSLIFLTQKWAKKFGAKATGFNAQHFNLREINHWDKLDNSSFIRLLRVYRNILLSMTTRIII
jgi:hypothetical protein